MNEGFLMFALGTSLGVIATVLVVFTKSKWVTQIENTDEDRLDYIEMNVVGVTNIVTDGHARWAVVTPTGVVGEITDNLRTSIDNAMKVERRHA